MDANISAAVNTLESRLQTSERFEFSQALRPFEAFRFDGFEFQEEIPWDKIVSTFPDATKPHSPIRNLVMTAYAIERAKQVVPVLEGLLQKHRGDIPEARIEEIQRARDSAHSYAHSRLMIHHEHSPVVKSIPGRQQYEVDVDDIGVLIHDYPRILNDLSNLGVPSMDAIRDLGVITQKNINVLPHTHDKATAHMLRIGFINEGAVESFLRDLPSWYNADWNDKTYVTFSYQGVPFSDIIELDDSWKQLPGIDSREVQVLFEALESGEPLSGVLRKHLPLSLRETYLEMARDSTTTFLGIGGYVATVHREIKQKAEPFTHDTEIYEEVKKYVRANLRMLMQKSNLMHEFSGADYDDIAARLSILYDHVEHYSGRDVNSDPYQIRELPKVKEFYEQTTSSLKEHFPELPLPSWEEVVRKPSLGEDFDGMYWFLNHGTREHREILNYPIAQKLITRHAFRWNYQASKPYAACVIDGIQHCVEKGHSPTDLTQTLIHNAMIHAAVQNKR